jgi:hypothetical protein
VALALRFPAHADLPLLPCFAAAYLCLALLLAGQAARPLKGRKRFEIEVGT